MDKLEKILEEFIKTSINYKNVTLNSWSINGAICSVVYYTDDNKYDKNYMDINIWDMLVFLNK